VVTLSDDSDSLLLSVLPEDAEPPELFELAELSDFCGCAGFATAKQYNTYVKNCSQNFVNKRFFIIINTRDTIIYQFCLSLQIFA